MEIRAAIPTLAELNDGRTMGELAQALHDAANAVKTHNKAAKVKLEITVSPFSNTAQGLIESPIAMVAKVTTKLPEQLPSTLFFVDEQGPTRNLTSRQSSFNGIGAVDTATGEIKNHG